MTVVWNLLIAYPRVHLVLRLLKNSYVLAVFICGSNEINVKMKSRLIVQRGKGFGSFLGSLARSIMPVVRKIAPKVVKLAKSKGVKKLVNHSTKAAVGVAADMLDGRSANDSVNKQVGIAKAKISKKLHKIANNPPKKPIKPKPVKRPRAKAKRKSILE